MILLTLAVGLLMVLVAPHLIPRTRLGPVVGITMWLSVLGLRALLTIVIVISFGLLLPSFAPFEQLTGWCLHAVLPFFATHLGMSGHTAGELASLAPAIAIGFSLCWAALGVWRSSRSVRIWLDRRSIGTGPAQSLIVGEQGLILATAGIWQPQVVVSAGALLELDDDELAAGIQHERGHVNRGHRFFTLLSLGFLGSSRLLPGGLSAFRELQFQLERDADEYSIRKTGDPLALAGAISKVAAHSRVVPSAAIAGLGGNDAFDRLSLLLADRRVGGRDQCRSIGAIVTLVTAAAALLLLVALPDLASAGVSQIHISLGAAGLCS